MSFVLFSESVGGRAGDAFKGADEMALAAVAHGVADACAVGFGLQQHPFGVVDAEDGQVVDRCDAHLLAEQMR